jgi:hypothetical protein
LHLVERFSQGMTEGPAQKDAPWRLHLLRVLSDDGDPDGGDTGLFNNPLNQPNGLIADPSARGEQDDIHPIGTQLFCYLDSGAL